MVCVNMIIYKHKKISNFIDYNNIGNGKLFKIKEKELQEKIQAEFIKRIEKRK